MLASGASEWSYQSCRASSDTEVHTHTNTHKHTHTHTHKHAHTHTHTHTHTYSLAHTNRSSQQAFTDAVFNRTLTECGANSYIFSFIKHYLPTIIISIAT
jgi:ABC-type nickel/cobalt efflux system permease component RcnA